MTQVSTSMINNDIVEASCVIDDKYSIIMGDERFYGMIGKRITQFFIESSFFR